jgi:TolB-like protein
VNPALDDRTWIVVPFDNTARSADVDWLRDASVNLLYLDLSKWHDIHVVDDKRVADLMREVPAPQTAQKLSLNDGLSVARRAGAGKLVMGDVLKVGSRTTVTATVFDVRNGSRVRSAREETTIADSLMPLFGKLARGILDVEPPEGANVGAIGTTRVDAYQEYLAGVQALNRFDATEARRRLERALQLDSTFALAHYKIAIATAYDGAGTIERMSKMKMSDIANFANLTRDPVQLAHATAAARLSGQLPARERTLINSLLARVNADFARACDGYASLIRTDSSDVEALYGLGECALADDAIVPFGGDTTHLVFRSSWNTALRSYRRAIAVDPAFHLAFDHALQLLIAPARIGCQRRDPTIPCSDSSVHNAYFGRVQRSGDSLRVTPDTAIVGLSAFVRATQAGASLVIPRRSFDDARVAAEEWIAAGPNEGRAHLALAQILLALGKPAESQAQLTEAMRDHALVSDPSIPVTRLESALKLGRGTDVNRILDSLATVWTTGVTQLTIAVNVPTIGRVAVWDAALATAIRARGTPPPPLLTYFSQVTRATLGMPGDSIAAAEVGMVALIGGATTCGASCTAVITPTLTFGLRLKRASWPVFDSTVVDRRLAPAVALSRGDTALLRIAAQSLDSASRVTAEAGVAEDGVSAVAVEAYLALGGKDDSTSALRITRRMLDTTLMSAGVQSALPGGTTLLGMLWPRMMLIRADLAAAAGSAGEAHTWYGRFLDLWMKPDAEFQPVIDRVRKAYAGGR